MDRPILDWLPEEETPEARLRKLKEYLTLPDETKEEKAGKFSEQVLTLYLTAMLSSR